MSFDIIRADTLPARHGFFGRKGGASAGLYAGLNCGFGSGDDVDHVATNRARATAALEAEHLVSVYQVHSADVVTVTAAQTAPPPKADALVTNQPGLLLSILTADCQPVLFCDPVAGVIGAAHAGWKGALNGVLENTVAAMEALGARASNISAVIGPSISQRAYEVGPEFFDTFMAEDDTAQRYFANGAGDRLLFDLPGFGLSRLRAAGIAHAEWTRHCTYSDPARFFSYRHATHAKAGDYGRLISAITL